MASLDQSFATYLTTARAFAAPVVEQAIASLNLADGARVLDIGTGGGGALPVLARAVGETGDVVALDRDSDILAIASEYAEQAGMASRITTELGDVVEYLDDIASNSDENKFDAIWASEVVTPGIFDEPSEIVQKMIHAVRPGGIIALLFGNHYRSIFLPGELRRIERLVGNAGEIRWSTPSGPQHDERYLAWLMDAGFREVSLRMYPRVGFPVDADPVVRPFLELFAFPTLRETAAGYGTQAGLSAEEVDKFCRLLTPGNPFYVLDDPGYFVAVTTILATGRRPQVG